MSPLSTLPRYHGKVLIGEYASRASLFCHVLQLTSLSSPLCASKYKTKGGTRLVKVYSFLRASQKYGVLINKLQHIITPYSSFMHGGICSLVPRPSHCPVFNRLQLYTASNHKQKVFLARQVFMHTATMATEGQTSLHKHVTSCLHSPDPHLFVTQTSRY